MDFEEKVTNTPRSLNRGCMPWLWCDQKHYCPYDDQDTPEYEGDYFCFPWGHRLSSRFCRATDTGMVIPFKDDEHTNSSKGMLVFWGIKDLLYNPYRFFEPATFLFYKKIPETSDISGEVKGWFFFVSNVYHS
jgi:hypothetical protein